MHEAASSADEPSDDRVRRYRELAEDNHALAMKAESPAVRAAYLELAAHWLALAETTGRVEPAEKRAIG